jgi:glycine cleavage system H protein
MNIPSELQYLKSHEWLSLDGDTATIGISDFAQDQLGDVVYVELPAVGRVVAAGEAVAVVESVKTASDIYSPVSGEVIAVNDSLSGAEEQVNQSPYGDGWLFKVRVTVVSADLLDADGYGAVVEAES